MRKGNVQLDILRIVYFQLNEKMFKSGFEPRTLNLLSGAKVFAKLGANFH